MDIRHNISNIVVGIIIMLAAPATLAGTIAINGEFSIRDANMWTGSAGATFGIEESVSLSLNSDLSVGGVEETLLGDYGASLTGSSRGSLDLSFSAHATAGRVDATLPFQLSLTTPDGLRPGEAATVSARVDYGPGFGFNTNSPDVGFRVGMGFDLNATASAQACFIDCAGFNNVEFIDIPRIERELLAINMGAGDPVSAAFDQQVRILGETDVLGVNFTDVLLDNLGSEIPLRRSRSGQTVLGLRYGGVDQNTLLPVVQTASAFNTDTQSATSSGLADVLTLSLDVGQLAADAAQNAGVPVPPPAGAVSDLLASQNITPPAVVQDIAEKVSYNLLTAKIGAALGFQQDFELQAPTISFDLDIGGQRQTITAGVGTNIEQSIFVPESLFGESEIMTTPTIDLDTVRFSNKTSLFVDPVAEFSALSLSLGPLSLGPVVNETGRIETPRITLFESSFALPDPDNIIGDALTFSIDNTPELRTFAGDMTFEFNNPDGGDLFNNVYIANNVNVQGMIETVLEESSISIRNGGKLEVSDRNFTLKGRNALSSENGTFSLNTRFGTKINIDGRTTIRNASLSFGDAAQIALFPAATLELIDSQLRRPLLTSIDPAIEGTGRLIMRNSAVERVRGPEIQVTGGENYLGSVAGSIDVQNGALTIADIPDPAAGNNFTRITLNSDTALTLTGNSVFASTFDTLLSMGGNSRILIDHMNSRAGVARVSNLIARRSGGVGAHLTTGGRTRIENSRFGDIGGAAGLASLHFGGDSHVVQNSYFGVDGLTTIAAGTQVSFGHTGSGIPTANSSAGYQNFGRVLNSGNIILGGGAFSNREGGFFSVLSDTTILEGLDNFGGQTVVGGAGILSAQQTTIRSGLVNVFGGLQGDVDILRAGTLTIGGGGFVAGNVTNNGILEGLAGGSLLGTYSQTAGGLFRLIHQGALGGPFIFQDNTLLDGLLELDLSTVFDSNIRHGFQFTAFGFLGNRTGEFSGYNVLTSFLTGNFTWEAIYDDISLSFRLTDLDFLASQAGQATDISIISLTAAPDLGGTFTLPGGAIPLPPTAQVDAPDAPWLLLIGLAALILQRRLFRN